MNGFNAHFGSGQEYGSLSNNGFGNQQLKGTLSLEQYAYSNDLDLNADQSSALNQIANQDSSTSELIIENVAASAIAKANLEQAKVAAQEQPKELEKETLLDSNKSESKKDHSNKSTASEQTFVQMKSRKKNKGKNKNNQNNNAEKLANEPHNKEVKAVAPIVHVDEVPVSKPQVDEHEYYKLSVPFGRHRQLPVMNEPNRVKNNIGLTQTSFDRFDHAPIMRVAAYGFSGVDYTQLARNHDCQEYLMDEMRMQSALHEHEVPFSHANEHLPNNFYGRDHSVKHPTSSLRYTRALPMKANSHMGNNMNDQSFNANDNKPFYSAQKTVNGTRLSISAFNCSDRFAKAFGSNLVRSLAHKQGQAIASDQVTLSASKSTNITYVNQVALSAPSAPMPALPAVLNQDIEQVSGDQEALEQKAHEIQNNIMEQGNTILSGNVSYAKPQEDVEQSIVIVRSKPSAFETSGEVKTIIRNTKALAIHGSNAPLLAQEEYLRLSQQVTLPEEYLSYLSDDDNDNEPNVFDSRAQILLGNESTRIVSTNAQTTQSFAPIFQSVPQITNEESQDNQELEPKLIEDTQEIPEQSEHDISSDAAQVNQSVNNVESVKSAPSSETSEPNKRTTRTRSRRKR